MKNNKKENKETGGGDDWLGCYTTNVYNDYYYQVPTNTLMHTNAIAW